MSIALVLGAVIASAQTADPGTVIVIWNNALYDGEVDKAEKHTSSTSTGHIQRMWGSLTGLVKTYERIEARRGRGRNTINSVQINGATACVTYTSHYGDGAATQWIDILFLENGTWKVAPQYAQVVEGDATPVNPHCQRVISLLG